MHNKKEFFKHKIQGRKMPFISEKAQQKPNSKTEKVKLSMIKIFPKTVIRPT